MARQSQATQVKELTPATPSAPPPPAQGSGGLLAGAPVDPLAPTPASELAKLSYSELRQRLNTLREQRSDLASRREALASGYEGATGANKEGMGARLQTLDNNIVMYEKEIAAVGRELAVKSGQRGAYTSDPGSQSNSNQFNDGDMAGAVFGTFLSTMLIATFVARRYVRRRTGRMPAANTPNMLASNERLDRIENAVDSIAVEIERVSENQRFMTRLMTETQLGDTLKDVRKSTELARNAAEG
jgi:hypothetical protein